MVLKSGGIGRLIIVSVIVLQSGKCFAGEKFNFVFLPDPFGCHQAGIETGISGNSTLGVLGRVNCGSDRPTYGSANSNVENTFSRILVPWKYSINGVFEDGLFVQALAGLERSKFKSQAGSTADVTFTNLAAHVGYQWYWKNGFNVSVMGGVAYLNKNNSDKNILTGEDKNVISFLNENTKTNIHGGAGIVVGWLFWL